MSGTPETCLGRSIKDRDLEFSGRNPEREQRSPETQDYESPDLLEKLLELSRWKMDLDP